jgi:hypothetical protein
MFVGGIDPTLLSTDTEENLLILTVFYGFLFAIVMLNVLVAVIFDAWGRVSPDGERIFFQYRHAFLMEAVDMKHLSGKRRLFSGLDRRMDALLLRFHHRPSELNESPGIAAKSCVFVKYVIDAVMFCFLFAAGLLSAGLLWPISFRRCIFSVGSHDEEPLDATHGQYRQRSSKGRRLLETRDHGEALLFLKEQLVSLQSDFQDLSDAVQDIHSAYCRILSEQQ